MCVYLFSFFSRLKFNLSAATPSDEESMLLRSIRLCKLGESLTEVKKDGYAYLFIVISVRGVNCVYLQATIVISTKLEIDMFILDIILYY